MATQERWAGAADQAGGGTVFWSNPDFAVGSELADEASADGGVIPAEGSLSRLLRLANFGFAIPTDAELVGITASLYLLYSTDYTVYTNVVQLLLSGALTGANASGEGGNIWGEPHSTPDYPDPQLYGYGGPYGTALWGATLTPADLNDPTFGIGLQARYEPPAGTAYVLAVKLAVTYTGGTVGGGRRFRALIGA